MLILYVEGIEMQEEYFSETQKIRPKIQKYLAGRIVDIGCGTDKVDQSAVGVDARMLDGVNFQTTKLDQLSEWLGRGMTAMKDPFDVVYSSHCLEHFQDDKAALEDWYKLLKPGGVMILYLPDDRHYDNSKNPEHLHRYIHGSFDRWFTGVFEGRMKIEESGLDVGHDKYSFFIVARKQ